MTQPKEYDAGDVVYCGKPFVPPNGYIADKTQFTYPNTVDIACLKGYVLQGHRVLRCEIDGQWSGNVIGCEPSDGPFPWWAPVVVIVLLVPLALYVSIKLYQRHLKRTRYKSPSEQKSDDASHIKSMAPPSDLVSLPKPSEDLVNVGCQMRVSDFEDFSNDSTGH